MIYLSLLFLFFTSYSLLIIENKFGFPLWNRVKQDEPDLFIIAEHYFFTNKWSQLTLANLQIIAVFVNLNYKQSKLLLLRWTKARPKRRRLSCRKILNILCGNTSFWKTNFTRKDARTMDKINIIECSIYFSSLVMVIRSLILGLLFCFQDIINSTIRNSKNSTKINNFVNNLNTLVNS